jgi:LL-diaminopimelate aminotransferase
MKFSERIYKMPLYFFEELDRLKKEYGEEVIDFGIGDPDLPTDERIIEALCEASKNPRYHKYSPYQGFRELRLKIKEWYEKRFEVKLDEDKEVLVLIGSKEGLSHLPYVILDEGDYAIIPSPSYPAYKNACRMAKAEIYEVFLPEENDFYPDLSSIPDEILMRTKIFYINYPNNPTGQTTNPEFFKEILKLAEKYDFLVVNDFVYSEIYYKEPPESILKYDTEKKFSIEIHSFSKTFNMTGWRLGFCVGNHEVVDNLLKFKSTIDNCQFGAIQEAGIKALSLADEIGKKMRNIYKKRKEKVLEFLKNKNIEFFEPKATFYIWAKPPENSFDFCINTLKNTKVLITPGEGFGEGGRDFMRFSLTVSDDKIKTALERLDMLL